MKTYDTIVIGGGIFGTTISRALCSIGQSVLVIDSQEPMAGSRPSGCLMKPSWFNSMGVDKYKPALELLDKLYGVQDIQFDLRPPKISKKIGTATVHWCDPAIMFDQKRQAASLLFDKVNSFKSTGKTGWVVGTCNLQQAFSRNLIVAAGVWTKELVSQLDTVLSGKVGVAFIVPKKVQLSVHTKLPPFIQPWAPFKQIVAYHRSDGLWVGDGSAIKYDNWSGEHVDASYNRCMQAIGGSIQGVRQQEGIRPYVSSSSLQGDPCLLLGRPNNLFIATGGAKNGTIAAGWCAVELMRRLS